MQCICNQADIFLFINVLKNAGNFCVRTASNYIGWASCA
ncbi:hypothetical protein T11_13156 [Trichinella zimbabwensis]|uniref:Uncharacterized protein n=1 Tax=Trichinella zimbabwensis TaxID=268475 RepID=A0A0V1DNZ2_9BILA|nr:hypothetical protein T11_13156 [Trichinella zimbabwensis]